MHPYNQHNPLKEDQPISAPEPDQQPTRWIDVKYQGALVYRVDADDPTHIQLYFRAYGKKQILHSLTTSRAASACGG